MNHLVFPSFRLDLDSELVLIDEQSVRLRPKSWAVLHYLAENPGRVVTKGELLSQIWPGVLVSDDMPRLCIGEIRKAIRDSSRASTLIETVHGKGYRLLVRPKASSGSPRTRLAVFRFVDHSRSTDSPSGPNELDDAEDLGALMTRGLGGLLATYDEFDVAGTRSTHAAQERFGSLSQQAMALNVATVLRGTVRRGIRAPDQIEVTAELIDSATNQTLWQRAFGRPEDDLSELQAHLADEVAEALRSADQPSSSMIKLQRSRDKSVYHLYLRGLRLQDRYESATWDAAEGYYREATEIDPSYAPAWAGLAAIALIRAHSGGYQLPTLFEAAREFAERALGFDPDLPDAHGHLATVETLYGWDFAAAERRYRTALALRPSFSRAYFSYQALLSFLGRHDEARAAGQRGYELDPLSASMIAHRGYADLTAREPTVALEIFEEALEGDSRNALARLGRAAALRDLGDFSSACEEFETCRPLIAGPMVPSLIAHALALSGEKELARQQLENLLATPRAETLSVPLAHRAIVHGALGEADLAFQLLDQAVTLRQSNVVNLIDTAFDPLRPDPRFAKLVERVGLPDLVAKAPQGTEANSA